MSQELRAQEPGLKGFLEKHVDSIRAVATATLTPDRMVKLVCAAASREPKLAECSPLSILRSMVQAAELGLEVCSGKNEGYLIPRWNGKTKKLEATFLPGYQGLIKLALETGKVSNIEARVVYEKDPIFEYELGFAPKLKHQPSLAKDRGVPIAFYAIAHLSGGGVQFEVMAAHEVEDIRDRSVDKDKSSPWKSDYSEMGRKTVVRRLAKYLPKSSALAKALEIQAKAESGDYVEGEILRPGDAPILTEGPQKTLNEDGDGVFEWTEEDVQIFFVYCETMVEIGTKIENENVTEGRIERYKAQKAGGESPEKVLNRMSTNIASMAAEEKAMKASA